MQSSLLLLFLFLHAAQCLSQEWLGKLVRLRRITGGRHQPGTDCVLLTALAASARVSCVLCRRRLGQRGRDGETAQDRLQTVQPSLLPLVLLVHFTPNVHGVLKGQIGFEGAVGDGVGVVARGSAQLASEDPEDGAEHAALAVTHTVVSNDLCALTVLLAELAARLHPLTAWGRSGLALTPPQVVFNLTPCLWRQGRCSALPGDGMSLNIKWLPGHKQNNNPSLQKRVTIRVTCRVPAGVSMLDG